MDLLITPLALAMAVNLIKGFEGVETEAYLDPVGVPTICSGLTRYPNGAPVRMGDVCNEAVCGRYLEDMLKMNTFRLFSGDPGWSDFGPRRQAVLISFAWNLGANFYGNTGFETISSVLDEGAKKPRLIARCLKRLILYVKANGVELEGLKIRRRQEGELWQCEDDGVMKFRCVIPTFLKKAPIQSYSLSNDGKQGFETGEAFEAVSFEGLADEAHAWITLAGNNERWAIYMPHWQYSSSRSPSLMSTTKWTGVTLAVQSWLCRDCRRAPVL